ncbi:phosphate acetyltransferase [Buchnera aphidicola]|uniref:phosphate acetyltransferase n=1 Tax=Buchnera aphidicola TaxID=9 RepID=UPI0031B6FFD1
MKIKVLKKFKEFLKKKVQRNKKVIIFPESYNKKILQAVSICIKFKLMQCVLIGNKTKIFFLAHSLNIFLGNNIKIISPEKIYLKYVDRLVFLRKKKGMNVELAKKILFNNYIILSIMMLENNEVDGVVAGIEHTTDEIIRPALQILQIFKKNSFVSSMFFMLLPTKILLYADCALNINPNILELSQISIQTANTATLVNIKAKIAILSYYTGYCKKYSINKKLIQVIHTVNKNRPDLLIEGPIQYDAAVSPEVSKLKYPNSILKGKANVLIFPDLNSGNITYKAVQRSSKIISIGPILQGLEKPVNDLSRGSSVYDIVYTAMITALQSRKEKS